MPDFKNEIYNQKNLFNNSFQNSSNNFFDERLKKALNDLRSGQPVILMDDFDRENEADLVIATEKINTNVMAQMIRDCSGIVCLCLEQHDIDRLKLEPMVLDNQSRFQTAFTVSIEAKEGIKTGVSAEDRVKTIRVAIDPLQPAGAIVSPGHVFPLQAQPGGVLKRRGHTEGAIDIVKIAGLKPSAVLCELMNNDGTMMRGDHLIKYAQKHNLTFLNIEEIASYRMTRLKI